MGWRCGRRGRWCLCHWFRPRPDRRWPRNCADRRDHLRRRDRLHTGGIRRCLPARQCTDRRLGGRYRSPRWARRWQAEIVEPGQGLCVRCILRARHGSSSQQRRRHSKKRHRFHPNGHNDKSRTAKGATIKTRPTAPFMRATLYKAPDARNFVMDSHPHLCGERLATLPKSATNTKGHKQ